MGSIYAVMPAKAGIHTKIYLILLLSGLIYFSQFFDNSVSQTPVWETIVLYLTDVPSNLILGSLTLKISFSS